MNSTQSAPPGRHNSVIIAGIAALAVVIIVVVAAFASGGLHFGPTGKAQPVAAAHHHKKHHHHQVPPAQAPAPAPAQAQPAAPAQAIPAGMRQVSPDLWANGNTSDAFAYAVEASYPGGPGTAEVYSPVTGLTYTITYVWQGAEVAATGGSDVYVQFPQ